MQRLLSLGQRRPPFPSSFFTPASSSSSNSGSSSSSRRLHSPGCHSAIRHTQSFGDSSRSRPPPSNKSSNGGGNGPKPAAGSGGSKGASNKAVATSSSPSSSNEASTSSSSSSSSTTSSNGSVSAARKARSQRANSRSAGSGGSGRRMRIDPFTNEGLSFTREGGGNASWLPRSIKPVDILRAHPAQISLDGFYALNRPLLQVTVSPKQRRYPSSEDSNNKTSKMMEIVGESEFSEEQIKAGQQDPFFNAEDQIGPYDLHLVTEPEGADPQWAKGTDKYLASLEHHIPPPLPSTSTSSPSTSIPTSAANTSSTTTAISSKKSNKKHTNQRQEAIDFLFPIQAEMRKAELEARQELLNASSSTSSTSIEGEERNLASEIQRLLKLHDEYEVDVDLNSNAVPRNAHQFDAMAGTKFLVGQLMKHRWSGMWEWEPTRRALVAASSSSSSNTPSTSSNGNAKGKAKADSSSASPSTEKVQSLQSSLDKLGKLSRRQAKAALKANNRGRTNGLHHRLPANGEILTASNGDDLQEMLARLAKDPKSQGKTIFIQMPLDAPRSSNNNKKKNGGGGKKSNNNKKEASLSNVVAEEGQEVDNNANEGKGLKMMKKINDEALLGEEEVKQVLEQVRKFQGFFDKSIDSELQNKASTRGASTKSLSTASSSSTVFNNDDDVSIDAKLVGLEWDTPTTTFDMSNSGKQEEEEGQHSDGLSWYVEERPSEETIQARHYGLLGSRMSTSQAYRGRSLRATLRERLALRDVDLVGPYKWRMGDVEMDSVKRKRRKRISKHKYKKRRKATRAERRRIGK